MATFRIVEVYECTRLRRWVVEADTEEAALEAAKAGEGELCNDGDDVGGEDYGDSGWAAVRNGDEEDAEDRALTEFEER